MQKYMIERTIPGAGNLTAAELQGISAKSVSVIRDLGPDVQWLHSYVVANKIYCVYLAKNPDLITEHARCGGFPVDSISEVTTMIDVTTGNAR